MFKRRKDGQDEQATTDETVVEEVVVTEQTRSVGGPYDVSEAPADEVLRVDLGGLQIPIVDNMQLHLEGHNEENNTFAIAIVVLEEHQSALQLMAVAAPRSGGFWAEVMEELESEIQSAGGNVARGEGRFGAELTGMVPAQDAEGNQGFQEARFIGAEGDRWFVRGMFMGAAATDAGMGEFFEDIIAGCIVNRGDRPMAPGDLIPLSPPEGAETEEIEDDDEDAPDYDDLQPFERGPEITETR